MPQLGGLRDGQGSDPGLGCGIGGLPRRAMQPGSARNVDDTCRERASGAMFRKLVYGDHPFGRPSLGKKELVAKFTAADCKAFHSSVIAPNNAILVLVGDFDNAAILKKVEDLTKEWKPTERDSSTTLEEKISRWSSYLTPACPPK